MRHALPAIFTILLSFATPVRAQREPFQCIGSEFGLARASVRALAQDARGFVWAATDAGLFRLDGRAGILVDAGANAEAGSLTALSADGRRMLYVGTSDGVRCIALGPDGNDCFDSLATSSLRSVIGRVSSLHLTGDGALLIACGERSWRFGIGKGIVQELDGNASGFPALPRISAAVETRAADTDADGFVWAATDIGLVHLARTGLERYGRAEGLPDEDVRSVLCDREGGVWCGTSSGLFRLQPGRLSHLRFGSPDPADMGVRHIAEAPDGTLWISTSGGVRLLRKGQVVKLESVPAVASPFACLPRAENTAVLATTRGVLFLSGKQARLLDVENGLPDSAVVQLLEARGGGYWIATKRGLAYWNGTKVHRFGVAEGLPSERITGIAEDRYGALWIATDRGIAFISKLTGGRFTAPRELQGVDVLCVFVDRANRPWFGTRGRGVIALEEGRPFRVLPSDGLATGIVHFISQDRHGTMYFGTPAGVFCLAEQNITRFFPRLEDRWWERRPSSAVLPFLRSASIFRLADPTGLLSQRLQAGVVMRDSAGNMWFGTEGGIARLTPSAVPIPGRWSPDGNERTTPMHAVLLSDRRIGDRAVGSRDTVTFSEDDDVFRARLVLPTFRTSEGLRYFYRLEGFEYAWHESEDGSILYTGLAPGMYPLSVQATIGDGIFTPVTRVVTLIVPAPFVSTRMFTAALLLLALLVGVIIGRVWRPLRSARDTRV